MPIWGAVLLLILIVAAILLCRRLRALPSDCCDYPVMDERHPADHR